MVGSGGKAARPGMLRGGRDDRDGTGGERKNKDCFLTGVHTKMITHKAEL